MGDKEETIMKMPTCFKVHTDGLKFELEPIYEDLLPMKWISVAEKLPPFHRVVLVVSDGKIYTACELLTWEDGHVTIYIPVLGKWKRFSHWMPLPEPPKEDAAHG